MTREEAIEWLGRIKDRYIHGGDEGFDNKRKEAIDMAIEALEHEPSEDLISREDALMQARPEYLNPQQKRLASYNQGWNDALDEYFDRIKEIPFADRPTGEWIPCSERLPNKKDLYMVTLKTFSDDYRFIDLLYYGKPLMPNCRAKGVCWYRSDSEWGDVVYDDTDILAWMPLPMPYREDGEE